MAGDVKSKRKRIGDFINELFLRLDPTGSNSKKYATMLLSMDDAAFTKWVTDFLADDKSQLRWDIDEFGERRIKFENIENAANHPLVQKKLFDYVYFPHLSSDPDRPVRSKEPVLVGELNIKRPQQMATKKTGFTISDRDRDENTGSAKGESKNGTNTGIENELLIGVGGEDILSEICGARGDNMVEYDNMLSEISKNGSVSLSNIKTNAYDKPTLIQADMYFMAMGIKTDIVSESYYGIDKIKNMMNK